MFITSLVKNFLEQIMKISKENDLRKEKCGKRRGYRPFKKVNCGCQDVLVVNTMMQRTANENAAVLRRMS